MVDPSMIYEVPIIPPPFDWIMLIKLALIIPVYIGILWIIGKIGQKKSVKPKNVAAMQRQGWVEGTPAGVAKPMRVPQTKSQILYKLAKTWELGGKLQSAPLDEALSATLEDIDPELVKKVKSFEVKFPSSTENMDEAFFATLEDIDPELAKDVKGHSEDFAKVIERIYLYESALLDELDTETKKKYLIEIGKTEEEGGPRTADELVDRVLMPHKAGDTVTGLPSPQKRMGGPPTSLNDFPDYLAFGTLDKESVKVREDRVFAEYSAGGNIVFRVDWGKDGCQLESLFEGKGLSISYGSHLKEAFTQYMLSMVPNENPHLARIAHEATSGKNVYFRFPGGEKLVTYYPAGFIFVLRQPIVESNREAWENLKAKFDSNDEFLPLKLEGERPGAMLRLSKEGNISVEEIALVDFSCVLVNVVEAVQVICEGGLIPPQKEYRLAVMDAYDSMPNMLRIHPGDSGSSTLAFAVLPIEQGSPELKKSIAAFTEGTLRFLKSHPAASSDAFQDRLSVREWFKKGANSKQVKKMKELVYGEVSNFGLVFINKEEAKYFAYLHAAIWEAEKKGVTWNEFRDRCPEVFEEIIHLLENIGWTYFDEWMEENWSSYGWRSKSEAQETYKESYALNDGIPLMEFPFEIRGSLIDIMDAWLHAGPKQSMMGFMPSDIQRRYGKIEYGIHGDEFLTLKTENEQTLVADLEKWGYTCIRDDDLVLRACGYD